MKNGDAILFAVSVVHSLCQFTETTKRTVDVVAFTSRYQTQARLRGVSPVFSTRSVL